MTKPDVTAQEPAEETPGEIEAPEVVVYYAKAGLPCAAYACHPLQSS